MAIALIVIAALLDGVDGRLARALKAQSKFGAELDSLADFVNFGVAPAVLVFVWGLGGLPRGFGWIVALVFALAMGLRLARFNSMIDVEKPKWQANYFTGMPAPAGAIVVLLPLYLDDLGLFDVRAWPWLIALYVLAMAFLLVSTIPTFSGKLLGERISGDYVLPVFVGAAAVVALLLTYPYGTLTLRHAALSGRHSLELPALRAQALRARAAIRSWSRGRQDRRGRQAKAAPRGRNQALMPSRAAAAGAYFVSSGERL